jgi:hypothetical protein
MGVLIKPQFSQLTQIHALQSLAMHFFSVNVYIVRFEGLTAVRVTIKIVSALTLCGILKIAANIQ